MTTINEARTVVYERFEAAWGALSAFTFENEAFTPPVGLPWVRVSVRNLDSEQECLGSPGHRRFKRNALAFAQVFVPGDSGTKDSDTLAEAFRDIFEGVSVTGLDFRAASTREVGVDNGWHQTLAEAPFDYRETK